MSRNHFTRLAALIALVLTSACNMPVSTKLMWPAESENEAANLTMISDEFGEDLSGAVWNPVTETLWVCRNGPGRESRLWVLREDANVGLEFVTRDGVVAEWQRIGDCEGVTFADFADDVVFLIVEGEEKIYEVDVSVYGEARVERVYDTSRHLPLSGKRGAEGITFVPDAQLSAGGFVDGTGTLRVSRHGMGGLIFVGHQNGGGVFAFDLDRASSEAEFVGEYRMPIGGFIGDVPPSVVGLEFDRDAGRMVALLGRRTSIAVGVSGLASHPAADASHREFTDVTLFRGPSWRSYEGLALKGSVDEISRLYLTVDDGGEFSLFRYDNALLSAPTP